MRVFAALLLVIASAKAAFLASDYLAPIVDNTLPIQEYIQPEHKEESATLADDGYRYKVVRKLRQRLRRDVNELQSSEYLPPAAVAKDGTAIAQSESGQTSVADSTPEERTLLSEDGYRYKTVRRLKYRHRRDAGDLPPDGFLPPSQEIQLDISKPEVRTDLSESGYRYKAGRPLKYRRGASELPAHKYIPSSKVQQLEPKPEDKTQLAEDGYRYKTVRRLKYRHRRDVSELPANEYLPPTEVEQPVSAEVAVVESEPEVKTDLGEDGYRYKTVRRLKYRHRRDVSELRANEYLPPTEVEQPVSAEVAVVESEPEVKTDLSEDGYRYKTVRRLIYRHRRDVSELPAKEYLPPTEVEQPVSAEVAVVESEPEVKTDLGEDGYRYKTVRRLIYRHRRDVSELPAKEYLPPTEVEQPVSAEVSVVESEPEVKTDLGEDGYRYKTVRRLKYRHRRDVSELPANEYLPPTEVEQPVSAEVSVVESEPEVKTDLGEDGYRYKTVRRLKYRHRRDVNELPSNEYLLPTYVKSLKAEIAEPLPEIGTELKDDGYHYKTVRRLKYRRH